MLADGEVDGAVRCDEQGGVRGVLSFLPVDTPSVWTASRQAVTPRLHSHEDLARVLGETANDAGALGCGTFTWPPNIMVFNSPPNDGNLRDFIMRQCSPVNLRGDSGRVRGGTLADTATLLVSLLTSGGLDIQPLTAPTARLLHDASLLSARPSDMDELRRLLFGIYNKQNTVEAMRQITSAPSAADALARQQLGHSGGGDNSNSTSDRLIVDMAMHDRLVRPHGSAAPSSCPARPTDMFVHENARYLVARQAMCSDFYWRALTAAWFVGFVSNALPRYFDVFLSSAVRFTRRLRGTLVRCAPYNSTYVAVRYLYPWPFAVSFRHGKNCYAQYLVMLLPSPQAPTSRKYDAYCHVNGAPESVVLACGVPYLMSFGAGAAEEGTVIPNSLPSVRVTDYLHEMFVRFSVRAVLRSATRTRQLQPTNPPPARLDSAVASLPPDAQVKLQGYDAAIAETHRLKRHIYELTAENLQLRQQRLPTPEVLPEQGNPLQLHDVAVANLDGNAANVHTEQGEHNQQTADEADDSQTNLIDMLDDETRDFFRQLCTLQPAAAEPGPGPGPGSEPEQQNLSKRVHLS